MTTTPKKKREHIDISFDDNNNINNSNNNKGPVLLRQVALFPSVGDNCAVCTKKVDAGLLIILNEKENEKEENQTFPLSHSALEGHRYEYFECINNNNNNHSLSILCD